MILWLLVGIFTYLARTTHFCLASAVDFALCAILHLASVVHRLRRVGTFWVLRSCIREGSVAISISCTSSVLGYASVRHSEMPPFANLLGVNKWGNTVSPWITDPMGPFDNRLLAMPFVVAFLGQFQDTCFSDSIHVPHDTFCDTSSVNSFDMHPAACTRVVGAPSQCRTRLGCAFRWGEALHPGPSSCFLSLGILNPTTVRTKASLLHSFMAAQDLQLLCLCRHLCHITHPSK